MVTFLRLDSHRHCRLISKLLLYDLICVTPCVTEGLIKLIKVQLNPNARLNQDIKVWNQIQRQRFKISSSV
jgi:hypothetical protein